MTIHPIRPVSSLHPVSSADPSTLLRRIGRHVHFVGGRVVVALVRRSRTYVDRTAWINTQAISPGPERSAAQEEVHAHTLLQPAIASIAPDKAETPPTHAVAMVRCRPGRVVWLPADEAWFTALAAETARLRLPVAEVFLVTEFGWRCYSTNVAGSRPALAA